jgi:2',3'-cyclic-nucleotide 2'-phosphodiesterase (5'-nucleotidase family)
MFRDGTFKGLEISPVAPAVRSLAQRLDEIDALVCLTHQSIENDGELVDAYSNYVVAADVKADAGTEGLAQRLAPLALIIGGHEHEPMLLQGSSSQPGGDGAIDDYYFEGELAGPGDGSTLGSDGIEKEEVSSMGKMSSGNVDATATAIVKTGSDAVRAAVATLTFRATAADDAPLSLESVDVAFTELAEFAPDAALESRVKQHMQLVESLASSVFVDVRRKVESLDPRQRQTSLGALVASSIRDETGAGALVYFSMLLLLNSSLIL